jgi:hypothetical protein
VPDILGSESLENLMKMRLCFIHPLAWLFDEANAKACSALVNTANAFRILMEDHKMKGWFKDRVVEAVQFPLEEEFDKAYDVLADSYTALAEIRAVGYLRKCGFEVTPQSKGTKGFDFRAKLKDLEIAVEVSAMRMSKEEMRKWLTEKGERTIYPAGSPKEGEFSVDNVAHRFVQKAEEEDKQLPEDMPSLLWLDLQFRDWWTLGIDEALPLYVLNRGRFRTGGLWLGFYGRKGTPLLDSESLLEGLPASARGIKHPTLRYPGYFMKESRKASAVIVALPDFTIILENPYPQNLLPRMVLAKLICVQRFDWPHSWVRPFWEEDSQAVKKFQSKVRRALRIIIFVSRHARFEW